MWADGRKDNGGARTGAGRKPVLTRKRTYRLTDEQDAMLRTLGGSPWLQGILNLLLTDRPGVLVLLLIDELVKKHGCEWLDELIVKIKARLAAAEKSEAEK